VIARPDRPSLVSATAASSPTAAERLDSVQIEA